MDLLLRQLTELGMTRWLPFISERSVPQPDARRQASRAARWARIAREAVKQCRRGRIPELSPVGRLEDVLRESAGFDTRIMFWEGARHPLPVTVDSDSGGARQVLLIVGPEGGFADEEAAAAEQAGFQLATLGPRILRAETATVAASTLVQHLYGDLRKAPPLSDLPGGEDEA